MAFGVNREDHAFAVFAAVDQGRAVIKFDLVSRMKGLAAFVALEPLTV